MFKKRKIETTGNFPWKIVLSEDTLLKFICNYSKHMRLNNFFYFLLGLLFSMNLGQNACIYWRVFIEFSVYITEGVIFVIVIKC